MMGNPCAMQRAIIPMSPDAWFRHLFSAQAARDGGVVRRKVRDVERMVGRDVFTAELRRRGYSAVENAGQMIRWASRQRKTRRSSCSRSYSLYVERLTLLVTLQRSAKNIAKRCARVR